MNRKLCEICEIRPIMSTASKRARGTNFPYCDPCQDLAEWENRHSDEAHDRINSGEWLPTDADGAESIMREMADCWICHPALDESAKDYKPRAGTSRVGMRMTVRRTMTGVEKAEAVRVQIRAAKRRISAVINAGGIESAGRTSLTVSAKGVKMDLYWDETGRYDYAASDATVDGKSRKVRNASEALKILGL